MTPSFTRIDFAKRMQHTLSRHSRAGGNPDEKNNLCVAEQRLNLSAAQNPNLGWIPACAGVTEL